MADGWTDNWTDYERAAKADLEAGRTAVCDCHKGVHTRLIEWAKERGLYVYCGRRDPYGRWPGSEWKNPFSAGRHGDREEVCRRFATYLDSRQDLIARLPELRGRLLGCWCAPARCHCDELARRVNALR